jgi:hypothetical protein
MKLALAGTVLGIAGACWLTRFLAGFLFGVQSRDPAVFVLVPLFPGLIVLRESGLSRQEQWDRIELVLQHLRKLNNPNFMLNKVIEIEGPDHFTVREIPETAVD